MGFGPFPHARCVVCPVEVQGGDIRMVEVYVRRGAGKIGLTPHSGWGGAPIHPLRRQERIRTPKNTQATPLTYYFYKLIKLRQDHGNMAAPVRKDTPAGAVGGTGRWERKGTRGCARAGNPADGFVERGGIIDRRINQSEERMTVSGMKPLIFVILRRCEVTLPGVVQHAYSIVFSSDNAPLNNKNVKFYGMKNKCQRALRAIMFTIRRSV